MSFTFNTFIQAETLEELVEKVACLPEGALRHRAASMLDPNHLQGIAELSTRRPVVNGGFLKKILANQIPENRSQTLFRLDGIIDGNQAMVTVGRHAEGVEILALKWVTRASFSSLKNLENEAMSGQVASLRPIGDNCLKCNVEGYRTYCVSPDPTKNCATIWPNGRGEHWHMKCATCGSEWAIAYVL